MQRRTQNDYYLLRVMSCMAVALLVLVVCVRFWPPPGVPQPLDIVYDRQISIQIDDIVPTTQQRRTPPPPAPLPPVVVPDDVIIDEELDLEVNPLSTIGPEIDHSLPMSDDLESSGIAAAESPKLILVVTPEYPRAARRRNIKAEVIIAVVVNQQGRVQSARIVDLYLLNSKDGTRTRVDTLGYGLEEAALSAAERSLFRPARQAGVAVRSNHQLSIKFGV